MHTVAAFCINVNNLVELPLKRHYAADAVQGMGGVLGIHVRKYRVTILNSLFILV